MIKSENKRVNITVTPAEWGQLQELTSKERLSVSKLVAQLIDGAAASDTSVSAH